jgi:hypothetical protein
MTPKILSEVVKTSPTDFMMNTTQTTPKLNNRQLSGPRGKFHAEDWLPLRDEWDFRSVTAEECRFACFWEYFRSIRSINPARASEVVCWVKGKKGRPGKGAKLKTGNFLCSRAGDLSKPYVTIDGIVYKKFSACDLKKPTAFVGKLKKHADPVSMFLWEKLSAETRQNLERDGDDIPDQPMTIALVNDINMILSQDGFYTEERFAEVNLETRTRLMQRKSPEAHLWLYPPRPKEIFLNNKKLLEEAYPDEISRNRELQPLNWRAFHVFGRATLVKPLVRIKELMKDLISNGHAPATVIDQYLNDKAYLLTANFTFGGTQKIIDELETWAIREAGRFPRAKRGKAAEPPYDCLKWLAAYRLDEARHRFGVSLEEVQDALHKYLHKHPLPGETSASNLPIYASNGAWSNAKGRAKGLLDLLESNPFAFEDKILR